MTEILWKNVTRAVMFKQEIIDEVVAGGSVVLVLPPDTPWKNDLIERIEYDLSKASGEFEVDYIDGTCGGTTSVEDYLFFKYCPDDIRCKYRQHKSKAAYLGEVEGIKISERYKLVRNIPKKLLNQWLKFSDEFQDAISKQGKNSAGFILLVETDSSNSYKNIKHMTAEGLFNIYDAYLFCAQYSSANSQLDAVDSYLAEVVVQIAQQDIELCEKLMCNGLDLLENPYDELIRIYENEAYSSGDKLNPKIIDRDYINQAIWTAQARTLFPVIEINLRKLIEKYYAEIKQLLPVYNKFDEEIKEPEQVELGGLKYWIDNGHINVYQEDNKKIKLMRDVRNNLAHRNIVSFERAKEVLYMI